MGVSGLSNQSITRGMLGYPAVVTAHLNNDLHFSDSFKEECNNVFICSCHSPYVIDIEICM
jgi:hypothetical protein